MATQTKQDAWITTQLQKANASIDTLRTIFLDGRIEKQMYKGAARERQYEKFVDILGKALNLIDTERKKL